MSREADPRAMDVLIALVLTLAAVAIVLGRLGQVSPFREDDLLGYDSGVLQTLPLAVRRRWPMGVLVIISLAVGIHSELGYQIVQAGTLSSLIALYGAALLTTAAGHCSQRALRSLNITNLRATYRVPA